MCEREREREREGGGERERERQSGYEHFEHRDNRLQSLGEGKPGARAQPRELDHGAGVRVRVQGEGGRVQGAGCRVQGSGFRVQGSGFRVQGAGLRDDGNRRTGTAPRAR